MTKENEKMHFPKVTLDNFFTTQEERDAENLEKVDLIPSDLSLAMTESNLQNAMSREYAMKNCFWT